MRMGNATLFSFLLGDSINDIVKDMKANGIGEMFAYFYAFSFVIIFMLCVTSVMVAVIKEEFLNIK
jgi:hypothetical protein